ncbi:hypothetical protein ANCDUO_13627 [Ancylostoma duodenale]|uniref:Uncharacterized protein n=1 Tax=Ancylostoma duodenale TaxID=51022 RepID=A0A0C2G5D2_9BILA|nr:hypothetical protein ANCDUO_13627 [Ancylostoma duodenale]
MTSSACMTISLKDVIKIETVMWLTSLFFSGCFVVYRHVITDNCEENTPWYLLRQYRGESQEKHVSYQYLNQIVVRFSMRIVILQDIAASPLTDTVSSTVDLQQRQPVKVALPDDDVAETSFQMDAV